MTAAHPSNLTTAPTLAEKVIVYGVAIVVAGGALLGAVLTGMFATVVLFH